MAQATDVHSTSQIHILREDELLRGTAVLSGLVARLHSDLRVFMSTPSNRSEDAAKDPCVRAVRNLAASSLDFLNELDLDPDFEPDCDHDQNTGDDEPSLGWSTTLNQCAANAAALLTCV